MIIRKAEKKDLKDVILLFKQLDEYHRVNTFDTYKIISEDLRKERFINCLSKETNFFIVAIENDKIVGFVDAYKEIIENHPIKNDKQYLIIENLIVDGEHRRKGIALELYRYVEDIAKKLNLDYIKLGVYEFNDAKLFYENIGFSTETRKMMKNLK